MSSDVDTTLRGPAAYELAKTALSEMESAGVWPTPLNFELWLHYLGNPEGGLAVELKRILGNGALTEEDSERLAAEFLPRAKLSDEIRDAGAQLSRELTSVASAIAEAQKNQAAYGETLAEAGQGLSSGGDIRETIQTLAHATQKVSAENTKLEQRLSESTREVVKLREHLEQVRREAMTDALTKLANRKAFDDELERQCATAEARRSALGLAVLDIDHFKRFNDTWGHQTGDQVIRYVASVIGRIGCTPRFSARYGGEEFAVIFPGEDAAVVQACLEEIREEVASRMLKRRSTNEDLGTVTISAGLATRHEGETGVCVMERADAALYASKRTGRNRVTNGETVAKAA